MREITTRRPFAEFRASLHEEFKVNGEVFKIDLSPAGVERFAVLWSEVRKRLEAASGTLAAARGEARALAEKPLSLPVEVLNAELERLIALSDDSIKCIYECAKEIINARLLDSPFDRLLGLCGYDILELARVVEFITELASGEKGDENITELARGEKGVENITELADSGKGGEAWPEQK